MSSKTINLNIDDRGIATVTLNRPDKHNALSADMISELSEIACFVSSNCDIRVVVLAANGVSFCAGGDLNWMRDQMDSSRQTRIEEAHKLARMLKVWNEIQQPVIAKIQGNAFGGGVGLISVCDTSYCSKTALFGLTEVKLGLIPATISPYVFAKIGGNHSRRVFVSAQLFNANEACRIGLITECVEDINVAVDRDIRAYLNASPGAISAAKALVRSLGAPISDAVVNDTVEKLADQWETPEARKGVSAFLQKRKPIWI